MIPKVLVYGSETEPMTTAVEAAFRRLGCPVEAVTYAPVRTLRQGNPLRKLWQDLNARTANHRLLDAAQRLTPDLVVCVDLGPLDAATVGRLAHQRPVVYWCLGPAADRAPDPALAAAFTTVYFVEPTDQPSLPNGDVIAPGFDPVVYHHRGEEQQRYDLTWVGSPRADRLPLLDEVARGLKQRQKSLALFGPFWRSPRGQQTLASQFPDLHQCIKRNGSLRPMEIAEIYNQSRICLFLHQSPTTRGLAQRCFEIVGSGSLLLTDHRHELRTFFEPTREVAVFRATGEIVTQAEELVENEWIRSGTARRAHDRAHREDRLEHRCIEIVKKSLGGDVPPPPDLLTRARPD